MSSDATPISSTRFASALKDLPISALHLKAAELRNSIAHLDYSNEQLQPFADGTEGGSALPDQDCIDAIRENEVVIERMQERMRLLRVEVEGRGSTWLEFRSAEELAEEERGKEGEVVGRTDGDSERLVNGMGHHNATTGVDRNGNDQRSEAWRDGTLQTGRIVNGEVRMDGNGRANGTAGRLDDEALRRAIEERMRSLGTDDIGEDGMHL